MTGQIGGINQAAPIKRDQDIPSADGVRDQAAPKILRELSESASINTGDQLAYGGCSGHCGRHIGGGRLGGA